MKLTKGMFGDEFSQRIETEFNIYTGQLRSSYEKITHNGGWYNTEGEKLGCGDLSTEDLNRIRAILEPSQTFIVLSEDDSFWAHIDRHRGSLGPQCESDADELTPGPTFVQKYMSHLVTSDGIYSVGVGKNVTIAGVLIANIPREEAVKKILSAVHYKAAKQTGEENENT